MSDARRIRHTMTAVQHLVRTADIRLGPTLERLTTELDAHDGFPANASGSGTTAQPAPFVSVGPNASTSSTERAALGPDERNAADTRAIGAQAALAELLDYAMCAAQALETIIRECDRRTPGLTDIDISRLRCATIPKGVCDQWADPARTDGLCCDHGRTVDKTKREVDLTRRALRDRVRYHNGNAAGQHG